MKKIVIIILAIVVVLGGAAALYFFVFSDSDKPEPTFEYSPGDYFVTNVKDSTKLFKTSVVLVVNDEKFSTETLPLNNAKIRDTIIFILRDLEQSKIEEIGIENQLRQQIMSALNTAFETDKFVDIYFNDFVMQ